METPRRTPPERQLASGANKVERMAQHSKSLVDDVTSWVELKLKLTQVEIQHKIQRKVDEVIAKIAPLVVGALGGFFLLVTIALGLGWWLDQPFWGFLIVTVVLLLVAAMLQARSKKVAARLPQGDQKARVSEQTLADDTYRS